jgi:hypothetical protein
MHFILSADPSIGPIYCLVFSTLDLFTARFGINQFDLEPQLRLLYLQLQCQHRFKLMRFYKVEDFFIFKTH